MKALIVDDEADLRKQVRIIMHGAGYETCETDSGDQVLSAVLAEQPDIVLLDVNLPVTTANTPDSICKFRLLSAVKSPASV